MGFATSGFGGILRRIARTEADISALVARLALGIVMFPHGAQKLLGWFGGEGWSGTLKSFHDYFGVPAPITALVILGESLGALGLIFGVLGRFCAFGVACVMLGAVFMAHIGSGFFMNWRNLPNQGHGFEYHILAIGLAVIVMLKGSGCFSFDRWLTKKGEVPA
jgi:putative oxidoreductase